MRGNIAASHKRREVLEQIKWLSSGEESDFARDPTAWVSEYQVSRYIGVATHTLTQHKNSYTETPRF